jgi:hypothetical protein
MNTHPESLAVQSLYTRGLVIWALFAAGIGLLVYMALCALQRRRD